MTSDREHIKAAKVCVKAASQMHEDMVGLHEAGEHEAAAQMDEAISGMHAKAVDYLEDVPEPEDSGA